MAERHIAGGWKGPITLQSAATTNGNGTALGTGTSQPIDLQSYNAILCDVTVTGGTVTINWEAALSPADTYTAVLGTNLATGAKSTTATATGQYLVLTYGLGAFRARLSSISGATVTVKSQPTNALAIDPTIVPGTAATNLGKAEDAAHTSGDVGVMALGVRAATPTDRSAGPTDGDYEPFGLDANGGLWISQATLIAGEDLTNNRLMTMPKYSYSAVAVADVQVKAGAGILHSVTISCNDAAPTAGSLIIFDSLTEAGTQVFNHTFTTTPFVPLTIILDYSMATGIYLGFTTTGDVNVSCAYL